MPHRPDGSWARYCDRHAHLPVATPGEAEQLLALAEAEFGGWRAALVNPRSWCRTAAWLAQWPGVAPTRPAIPQDAVYADGRRVSTMEVWLGRLARIYLAKHDPRWLRAFDSGEVSPAWSRPPQNEK